MNRSICIHGHFYQPERSNPWLESIELQESAAPFHDWNERITAETYATNAAARILNQDGRITEIVNNFAKISFDVGPTLLAWMEKHAPEVYRAILDADHASRQQFSGHGGALAQCYNHLIMPLANPRDKRTQVRWGLRDFEHRFGRPSEGMWLPETAVDIETLEILAEHGIKYTILAPHQAARCRKHGATDWQAPTAELPLDTRFPYEQRLPSGKTIAIFFYDAPISIAVAFSKLLDNGEEFAQRFIKNFSEHPAGPELVHIATDGETYGHHHRHGDMALAYALRFIEANNLARVTNYGEYLAQHPPTHEVEIVPQSAWSCAHGVERWRSDCGCRIGNHANWKQTWRGPLRAALDWLRDTLLPVYEPKAAAFLKDPWTARDEYIDVILDRSPQRLDKFLSRHARRKLTESDKITVLKLLELQRHALLMFTSCGWFFDELSGIETQQILLHAARALQLAEQLGAGGLELRFLELLAAAKSNLAEFHDGARVYEKLVRHSILDVGRIGAIYAVRALFEECPEHSKVHCYVVEQEECKQLVHERGRLVAGRATFYSEITHESATLTFGAVHFDQAHLSVGVRESTGDKLERELFKPLAKPFQRANFPEAQAQLSSYFGGKLHSARSLPREERHNLAAAMLQPALAEIRDIYSDFYQQHAPALRFLVELDVPHPKPLHSAATFALNWQIRSELEKEELNKSRIGDLVQKAKAARIHLDPVVLDPPLKKRIERSMHQLAHRPTDLQLVERLRTDLEVAATLPIEVTLWSAQNSYYSLLGEVYPEQLRKADHGDATARSWLERFGALGDKLRVQVAEPKTKLRRKKENHVQHA